MKNKTNWEQYCKPIEGECNLGKEVLGDQCCCICKYHLIDYWHCLRMPEALKPKEGCGCHVIKGYICTAREIHGNVSGQSGWPKHSMGCECFTKQAIKQFAEGK